MKPDAPLPDRLKAGSPGLGEAASSAIERRALEGAMIDGRDAFTDADLARAANELAGGRTEPVAPEADAPGVEQLTVWEEPADQGGQRITPAALEDEASATEQLIQDGIDEADHHRRVAAAEEAREEEPED